MAAERQVGRINYELKIRGNQGLDSASSSNVKAQSFDLVKLNSDLIKEYRYWKVSMKTNILMKSWNESQCKLLLDGISEKMAENIRTDKRRNEDLTRLKRVRGPFVCVAELHAYMDRTDIDLDEKSTRLYHEVRYARDTCLSMPKSSEIFRLKGSHKCLSLQTYVANLKIYFDRVETNASVDHMDFATALDNLLPFVLLSMEK